MHVDFENNRFFCQKNVTFGLKPMKCEKMYVLTEKSIFLEIDVWYNKTVLGTKQHP